jgi:regulatory protein YycH of two-component signal transduction system YycFG
MLIQDIAVCLLKYENFIPISVYLHNLESLDMSLEAISPVSIIIKHSKQLSYIA